MKHIIPVVLILLVFIASNVLISYRLYQFVKVLLPKFPGVVFFSVCILAVALVFLSFMRLSPVLDDILGVYSAYWMGCFVYLLFYGLICELVMLVLRLTKAIDLSVVPKARGISVGAVLVLTLVTVVLGVIHCNHIETKAYRVESTKDFNNEKWKIVLLSDIHLGAVNSEKRLFEAVDKINEQDADIVCIAGDFFDSDFSAIKNPDKCMEKIKTIKSRLGVYACFGNHDAGKTQQKMSDYLSECNITLLDEKSIVIEDSLVLAGRLDSSPIGGYDKKKRGELSDIISESERNLPVVVLDHNPENIDEYPDYVDLILCGHTHRGQVFPGNLITKALYTVDYGYYRKSDSSPQVIVTSGAGIWGPPVRVGTDSEIVVIDFSHK